MGSDDLGSALYWLSWFGWAKTFCSVLVATGIGGMLLSDWLASPLVSRVETARQIDIVHHQEDIARANQQMEEQRLARARAEQQMGQLQGEAARANQQVEELRLARAKVQDQLLQLQSDAVRAMQRVEEQRLARTQAEQQIAQLQGEAARANQKAEQQQLARAQVEQQLAQMQNEVAVARQKAEEEQLIRLRMEEKLSPRTITPTEQASLRDRLKPFGPQSVDIFMFGDNYDIANITDVIAKDLREAGWNAPSWRALGAGGATGVLVQTRLGAPPAIETAADELVKALNDAGVQTTRWSSFTYAEPQPQLIGSPWSLRKASPIRVIVGAKP